MQTLLKILLVSAALVGLPKSAIAGSEPFIGEIQFFAGNFAPRGWAFCNGQTLQIAQYTALFSILGTTYGGDGRVTFNLPDLRGRSPLHVGQGPGLSSRQLGQKGGAETNLLTLTAHTHSLNANSRSARETDPTGRVVARTRSNLRSYDSAGSGNPADLELDPASIGTSGVGNSGDSVENMHPALGVNCIIALEGIFPSRS